jgi:hypothetical protein
MKCKCGNDEKFFLQNGQANNQVGLYCDRCGKWLKWASKDDKNIYNYKEETNKTVLIDLIDNMFEQCKTEGELNALNDLILQDIKYSYYVRLVDLKG